MKVIKAKVSIHVTMLIPVPADKMDEVAAKIDDPASHEEFRVAMRASASKWTGMDQGGTGSVEDVTLDEFVLVEL